MGDFRRPQLALIHGWGIGKTVWQPLRTMLEQVADVHLLDLPGYGSSPADGGDFAHAAQAMLSTLPPNVVLCGWSLGGLLAMQGALLAPHRVSGLILIGATASFTQRPDWLEAQPPSLLAAFSAAVAEDPKTLQRFVALLNQGDTDARAATRTLNAVLAAQTRPDPTSLIQGLDWLRDVDLRPEVARITVPTLLIHGDRDPLMPLSAAHWLRATLPDCRLEIVAGAAHAPFIHSPETVAELIGDYCHASTRDQTTCTRVI